MKKIMIVMAVLALLLVVGCASETSEGEVCFTEEELEEVYDIAVACDELTETEEVADEEVVAEDSDLEYVASKPGVAMKSRSSTQFCQICNMGAGHCETSTRCVDGGCC